jgi:uncharacterized delta-60 repeat protein
MCRVVGLALMLATATTAPRVAAAEARDGQFDPVWGTAGVTFVRAPVGAGYSLDRLYGAVVDADDRLLLFGTARSGGRYLAMILRLDANGQPDPTFGSAGFALIDLAPSGITGDVAAHAGAVLGDGRIVVLAAQSATFLTVPFSTCTVVFAVTGGGSLAAAYGPGPGPACLSIGTPPANVQLFEPPGTVVAIDAERVLVGGPSTPVAADSSAVTRLDALGRVDTSFGNAGVRHYGGAFSGGVHRRPGLVRRGERVAAAGAIGVAEGVYVGDLSLAAQPGYGTSGVASVSWQATAALQEAVSFDLESDGSAWLAGFARSDFSSFRCNFCVSRFDATGSLDVLFNPSGEQPGSVLHLEPGSSSLVTRILGRGRSGAVVVGNAGGAPLSTFAALVYALRRDGSIDSRFGDAATPGRVLVDTLPAGDVRGSVDAELDSRGRILVAIDGTADSSTAWGAIRLIDQRVFVDGFEGS